MRIPDSIIEEVSEKTDILSIVGEYTVLKKKGDRYWACCPFHNEKTPSFSVSPDRNMYYCFGCHKGGGLFQFIMEIEKLSFPEAVRFAAEKTGIEIPEDTEDSENRFQRNALKELYNRVAGSLHYILMNSDRASRARQYLADRGIHEETILRFQLGYAPADPRWMYDFLKSRSYSDPFLEESGLFSRKYKTRTLFTDRLMFPIFSNQGDVVAFSGRTMRNDSNTPKYINSPETTLYRKSDLLYGLWQSREGLRKTGVFYLCEGNVDVLALNQTGFTTAMAPLGTAFTEGQAKLLKRYAPRGYIIFDSDNAGIKATYKAAQIAEQYEIQLQVIKLPEKTDPAEIIEKDGPETLKNIVKSPINVFDYLLDYTMACHNTTTPEGKEQAVKDLFPYIESIESEIKRDLCLGTLAETLGINNKALLYELNRQQTKTRKTVRKSEETIQIQKMTDELLLMIAVALHREFLPHVDNRIGEFDFQDRRAVILYNALKKCNDNKESSTEILLSRIEDESVTSRILEKISTGELDENAEDLINKTLDLIRRRHLEARSLEISRILDRAGKENISWDMINELIVEKKTLDSEIAELKVRE